MSSEPYASLDHIASLASDSSNAGPLLVACGTYLSNGGGVAELDSTIMPHGWRYQIASGLKITLQHRDKVFRDYAQALEEMREWRSFICKVSFHEQISVEIHQCRGVYEKLSKLLMPGESLGDFDETINELFRGTGYCYDGQTIVDNFEDDENWDEEDPN